MAICRSGDVLGYCIEQMVVPMLLEAARLHSPVKVKLQGKKVIRRVATPHGPTPRSGHTGVGTSC